MRLVHLVAAALLCVSFSACTLVSTAKETAAKKVTAAATAGVLDVRTMNGSVEIRKGQTAEMQVDATFRAETKARLSEMDVVMEPDGAGGTKVSVKWPAGGRKPSEGCSLKITTPGASGVRVESGNGAVVLAGLSGEAKLNTSNGRIEVSDHAGKVVADTSNGPIEIREAVGEVRATTSNGRIEATNVWGSAYAKTSNGPVTLKLSASNASPFDVQTSNGAVRVEVGAAFGGMLDAQTSNGSVRVTGAKSVEQSKSAAKAVFGEGDARSTIKTSNGGVEVSRRP